MALRSAVCLILAALQADPAPDGWAATAAREEIAPRSWVERSREPLVLGLAGKGDEAVDGRWSRSLPVTPGKHYVFSAQYLAKNVASPARSILARVVWVDARGKSMRPAEYPFASPHKTSDGWSVLTGTYRAPEKAAKGSLELHLRWAAAGEVLWRNAQLIETEPPAPRKVRLASVNHRPRGTKSTEENLARFAKLIDDAAGLKADIVCLPEGITIVGNGRKYADAAEPIPGPTTKFLGEIAARHKMWIVAGFYEREGSTIYNASVLIGRDGGLAGKYRKVCLPDEEIDAGITPGKDYPVFDTDFGRIGMMVCWDVHFPEVARELSARGAEVIFLPIWGGNELLAKARATENQVFLVASGYDFKTGIFDKAGQRVADTVKDPEVVVAEVDLNERLLWPWLGEWRARIWREGPAR